MGIKKKAAEKVIKTIAKNVAVDKILDSAIDKVTNSLENGVSNSVKNLQAKKEKNIEDIKNYKVGNNSEDIINFFIEAKRNIKTKDIDSEEYNMWFLKVDEVYEKAQETISDEERLKKITEKYEEFKRIKKIKNFLWVLFALFYVVLGICIVFVLNGMLLLGLGISMLVAIIITFIYFNIDFTNIKKSIKDFKFKETTENAICLGLLPLAICIIVYAGIFYFTKNEELKEGYRNYYDESIEKYDISIEIDFKDNLLFNKSDITLKLYDKEEVLKHGEDKTLNIQLPKGTHKLEFEGNNDTETVKLKIEGNTKVKYKLECLAGGIEVNQE